jgi:hypothetical protein
MLADVRLYDPASERAMPQASAVCELKESTMVVVVESERHHLA